MKLADAAVVAVFKSCFQIRNDFGRAVPIAGMKVAVIGAQLGHDAAIVFGVEGQRAVVGGARDQRPVDTSGV